MGSVVLHYPVNDSNLGINSAGSGTDLINTDVTLVTDPERGPVAYFNGTTSGMELPAASVPSSLLGNNPRSVVLWFKSSYRFNNYFITFGNTPSVNEFVCVSSGGRVSAIAGTNATHDPSIQLDIWHHYAATYDSGSLKLYLDGVLVASGSTTTIDTSSGFAAEVGKYLSGSGTIFYAHCHLSDLRVYDFALSDAEVLAEYQRIPSIFTNTPSSTLVESSWSEVVGATSYRLTSTLNSIETTLVDSTSSLEHVTYNLTPETTYEMRVYSLSDDINYTLAHSGSVTTLSETSTNANIEIFNTNGVYDLSVLNDTTLSILQNRFNELVPSGTSIVIDFSRIPVNTLTLVTRGSTLTIPDGESILVPFQENEGPSQEITLELAGTSSVVISYDDTTNNISLVGQTYSVGESFILNGKKVTVLDI